MSSLSPWQFGLRNSKDRDNALFLNERLSDLTIIFPYHNIYFPAHRLMMAKTSPYFEHLFYGPMAIHDHEWNVKDDEVEPEVFKVVLAHCYELDLLNESLEITLKVYELADRYLIDSLKSQCLEHLQDTISNSDYYDIQPILEWSTKYGFLDIEEKVFEVWSNKLNLLNLENRTYTDKNNEIHNKVSNLLLNLPSTKHKKFLSKCEHLDILFFEESWRHPEEILSCEILMSILEGSSCQNDCNNEYSILKGCISSKILNQFMNIKIMSNIDPFNCGEAYELSAYISLINDQHSQALYECIKDEENDNRLILWINLHIPCNKISPKSLAIWASKDINLYLSNVDDQSVPWVVDMILSLKPGGLYLPRSSLSCAGFKTLIDHLKSLDTSLFDNDIYICSCNIRREHLEEIGEYYMNIYESDNEIPNW